jgi:hypothetical protein
MCCHVCFTATVGNERRTLKNTLCVRFEVIVEVSVKNTIFEAKRGIAWCKIGV